MRGIVSQDRGYPSILGLELSGCSRWTVHGVKLVPIDVIMPEPAPELFGLERELPSLIRGHG